MDEQTPSNVVNLADYLKDCQLCQTSHGGLTHHEILYLMCVITARRVMTPDTRGKSNQNVTVKRDNLSLVFDTTDDGFSYITLYYDYQYDPSPALTLWKGLHKGKMFTSIFYNVNGEVYLEKQSDCLVDGLRANCDVFDELLNGQLEAPNRNMVLMTQLLFLRHKDSAGEIVETWDADRHQLTAHGVQAGGHELFDWPYINDLCQRFIQQIKWVSEEEVSASLAAGFH